jgi:hypothetical protein
MPSICYNAVVDADSAHTWRVIKQFGGISLWHPAIDESVIESGGPDGMVGCVRRLTLQGGAILRERMLAVDDSQLSFAYCFEEAPLPVDNYVMSVKLIPLTDQQRTVIQWKACFDLREPDPQSELPDSIRALIVDGHNSLGTYLAQLTTTAW